MNHADPSVDQADMQACAREAIEFLGQVQPHGFLIECSPDWIVRRVSANMRSWFGRQPEQALGAPLSDLFGPRLIHDLRGELQLMGNAPSSGVFTIARQPAATARSILRSTELARRSSSKESLRRANLIAQPRQFRPCWHSCGTRRRWKGWRARSSVKCAP